MKKAPIQVWHSLETSTILQALHADAGQGLSDDEARRRSAKYGPNQLTVRRGKGPLRLFLSQFHQPLIYILLCAGALTAFLEEWVDSSVIFGVVLVNAIIGFIQEANALKEINALAQAFDINCTVLRGGLRRILSGSELVPGDIVILQSGDKVPADLRLLKIRELQIDESAFTGESMPVEKRLASLPLETVLADCSNMAFSSTLVTYGSGIGVVMMTLLQLIFTYWPPMHALFGVAPIRLAGVGIDHHGRFHRLHDGGFGKTVAAAV